MKAISKKQTELLTWIGSLMILCLITIICFQGVVSGEKTFINLVDNTLQSYAWIGKNWNALRNGEIALWDFNQYCGVSFAGEIQTAPFYIGNFLFTLLTPAYNQHALDLYILFHYWLASVFMFGFLKYNKQSWLASLSGAVLFAYIGSVSARSAAQSNIFMSLVYLPGVIWTFQVAVDRNLKSNSKSWGYIILSGFLLGLMVLAGHMQPYLHAVIALGMFVVCYSNSFRDFKRNVISLIFVGFVSLIVCFGQVVSGLEYMNRSYRWIGLEKPVTGFGILPSEAYGFVVASLSNLGDIVVNNEIGDGCTFYISIAGLVLFCIGFAAICYSWKKKEPNKRLGIYAIATTLLCIVLSFGRKNLLGLLLTVIPGFSSVREPARILFVYDFSVAIVAAMGISFIESISEKVKIPTKYRKIIASVVGCVALISVVYFAVDFNAGRQVNANGDTTAVVQYEKNELVDYLISETNRDCENGYLYRYNCDTLEETLTPNLGSIYCELLGTHGHRATMQANYYDFLGKNGWNWNEHLPDAFAVKYLVTQRGADKERYSNFTYLTTLNERDIYEKTDPTCFFTMCSAEKETVDLQFDRIDRRVNSISIWANIPFDGTVRIAQLDYPGWHASIDGTSANIETDDEGFMTIDVDSGEHEIKIVYKPWWLTAWIILIVGFSAFIMAWLYIGKRNILK